MFREFTTEVTVFARADYNILDFGAVACSLNVKTVSKDAYHGHEKT